MSEPSAATTVTYRTWSPAQIVAILIGLAAVILGIAALARTGVPFDHLNRPQHVVLGLHHSPLLGLAEVAFGALLILSGLVPGGVRSLMVLLGVIALGFGVVVLVDAAPYQLHRWVGVHDPYGWTSLIAGSVLVLSALFLPDVTHEREARSGELRHS